MTITTKLKIGLIVLLPYLYVFPSAAQTDKDYPWMQYYDQLIELEDIDDENIENTYDILMSLSENKINLNTATREDLEQIIFLTPQQIEEISEYIYKYGPIRTMGELAMIESLDAVRRQLLSYFVYIDNEQKKQFPTIKNILKYGKNDIIATAKIPLYERKGDKNGYMGYKYKHWFRYMFKYGQYVQIGLTGSQDAGEPFFAGKNSLGYDYYSFYMLVRKLGRIKTLAAGRYRLKFGMGLIMNNDFSLGKIASISSYSSNNSIRAHSSRSMANYLQGAAVTYNIIKGLDITAFASYRKIDATPGKEPNTITTIRESGYHRTPTEMAYKNNTSHSLFGGNIRFFKNGFHIGMTSFYTGLNKKLQPNTSQIYRKYYPSGKNFTNTSIDYGYTGHKLSVEGESAIDGAKSLATINRITYQPISELSLTLLQRFYSYKFETLFGQCFNDGGRIQNESGIYMGVNWNPSSDLSVMYYFDYAYFPWAKYQISSSSHSIDNFISGTLKKNNFYISSRYRIRLRQKDNSDKTSLIPKIEQRGRIALGYDDNIWSMKMQLDMSDCKTENNSFGWMVSQTFGCKYKIIDADIAIGYFDTDDYDSRIYCYEKGLLYSFSFPVHYGKGIRYSINVRADIQNKIMIACKLGSTKYFDRNKISSSYQEIDGSSMTDIEVQIRWKF